FCAAICNYCNFTRGLLDEAVKTQLVAALVADIRSHAESVAIETVFFGGGTPSLLTPAEVDAILTACRESFELATDAEITLEANPESASPERLDGYRRAGVNRLSFGVQSFRDDELRRLGRLTARRGRRKRCAWRARPASTT
ncbi:MAG: radical SAM protein, partial [Acidobacteriota bacterium]